MLNVNDMEKQYAVFQENGYRGCTKGKEYEIEEHYRYHDMWTYTRDDGSIAGAAYKRRFSEPYTKPTKMESPIGKKVRIIGKVIGNSDVPIGAIGTIIDDKKQKYKCEGVIKVKLDTGEECTPWAPWLDKGECEWYTEPKYTVQYIKGKKIAIHCGSQEEYAQVVTLMDTAHDYSMAGKEGGWRAYNKEVCVDANNYPGYAGKTFWVNEGYEIITAKQFLTDNKTDMTTQEKIESLEQQLKDLKESLIWKPKVGDWVTCKKGYTNIGTYRDPMYAGVGYTSGKTICINTIEPSGPLWVNHGNILWSKKSEGIYSHAVRLATPEEIAEAQSKTVTVTIGEESKQITINSKKQIVAPDGKIVAIADVNRLLSIMKDTTGFNGWSVTFNSVTVGCIESISYKQLKEVQDQYEKLNS